MASPTVNVVRYSALIGGALYGIMHRRTLQAREDLRKESHHTDRRDQLIQQAREAWKNKQQVGKSDVITNPEDPNFDLEKLFAKWEKEYS